jgi:hypothetical protein
MSIKETEVDRVSVVTADVVERAMTFVSALLRRPPGAEISLLTGRSDCGEPAVGVLLDGVIHPFMVAEARAMADCLEGTMNALPNNSYAQALPDIILCLRDMANRSEKRAREKAS